MICSDYGRPSDICGQGFVMSFQAFDGLAKLILRIAHSMLRKLLSKSLD